MRITVSQLRSIIAEEVEFAVVEDMKNIDSVQHDERAAHKF